MIEVTWIGWDGSRWDLTHGPLRLTAQALEMLLMFESEAFVSSAANVDGQQLEGWRGLPREFDLQVATAVIQRDVASWASMDYSWKRTMRPDKYGQFVVSDPSGRARTLTKVRMKSEATPLTTDPSQLRRTTLTYGMVADDPWWYGAPETATFEVLDPPINFFGPTGFGPSFFIAPVSVPDAAVVLNPGDVSAWPVWTFYGPAPSFSVSVNGQVVSSAAPIAAGEWVEVDTRPFRKSAIRSDGVNITRTLTSRRYAEIPAGENAAVDVAVFDSARTVLRVDPKFFRGFN